MKRIVLFCSCLLLTLTACDPGESPVAPPEPTDASIVQVDMQPNYDDQLFFNLATESVVATIPKVSWDLGFEAHTDGWRVYLNSSRGGAIHRTNSTDFGVMTSTDAAVWQHDASSWHPDSTAAGDYRTLPEVLVLDRGYNAEGLHTGYRKFQVESHSVSGYQIRVMDLDGGNEAIIDLPKDAAKNRVAVSFESNSVVEAEPDTELWDLLFTQYTHLFADPPLPYLVNGVLINQARVAVAIDHEIDFVDITLAHAQSLEYSTAADVIGYNWKIFTFTSGFVVLPEMNYIIRDGDGRYFKLHFIDFYDDLGEKGAPKFEMQELI
ncbi:MAG: HmuY family protein [Bacteroidota bacterium]